jgi:hypothetical protein
LLNLSSWADQKPSLSAKRLKPSLRIEAFEPFGHGDSEGARRVPYILISWLMKAEEIEEVWGIVVRDREPTSIFGSENGK